MLGLILALFIEEIFIPKLPLLVKLNSNLFACFQPLLYEKFSKLG